MAITHLLLAIALGSGQDTTSHAALAPESARAGDVARVVASAPPAGVAPAAALAGALSPSDTTARRRPRAVEVSDAYEVRLRIHRYASFALVPLFAAQSVAGNQMYQSGGPNPSWAKHLHDAGAGGLAALFTVNTVTGLWNLWDSRGTTEGRTRRLLHSGLMLAADAGFTYAGVKLGPDARHSFERRSQHRRVATISMGGALLGYATMLIGKH